MHWNSDNIFPRAPERWSALRPPWGRKIEGESAVRRAIWQWHPFDPIIVSIPGEKAMLPPICFAGIAPQIKKRMHCQFLVLFSLMLCMALGFAIASFETNDVYFIKASASIALCAMYLVFQHIFIFRRLSSLCEYSRFSAWCYLQPKNQQISIATMMISIGAIQLYLQTRAGSLFNMIEQYGLVFQDAPREPWRYLSGPFLHSGVAHWAANLSLLMVAAGLSFSLGRALVIWLTFLSGVLLPAFLLTFLPHSVSSDAFLGISGGVFALYGWMIGTSLRNRQIFPPALWWLLAYFALATMLASSLLSPRTSWFAHASGLLLGCVIGLLEIGFKHDLKKPMLASSDTGAL
ncbi:rhomboid family intramembrane serine protease [Xanthomonas fragariae]|uniref:rhomboid family intramembrane serine protease n=1 Tax=Xanthomonas fragariae TaxID=48664 RepID=UPI0022AAA447|nr:rhomboid family intramembrane serine protease [Xanthomonas fragariae]WAT14123.1 rhomboid family intramembrane serine protease [Xanthomonas fragariae]